MKLYTDHTNTGKLIEDMETRKNTWTMVYYSVTIQSSQNRMSNFNTDIEEYLSTKKKKPQVIGFCFILQNILLLQTKAYWKKKKLKYFFLNSWTDKRRVCQVLLNHLLRTKIHLVSEINRNIRDNEGPVVLFQRTLVLIWSVA